MTLLSFAVLASLALAGSDARRITHSGRLFRKSILNVQDGEIVVPNQSPPKTWTAETLEPYNEYHFRFEAIGCNDVTKDSDFYTTCCRPRPANKADDSLYPVACNIAAYLIEAPVFNANEGIGKLVGHSDREGESGSSSEIAPSSTTPKTVSTMSSISASATTSKESSKPAPKTSTSSSLKSNMPKPSSSSTAWGSVVAQAAYGQADTTTSTEQHRAPLTTPSAPASTWISPSAPAPSTTSTPAWTPSSSPSAAETSAQSAPQSSNSDGQTYYGQATWFLQNGNPGACGVYNSDSTPLVALDYRMYGNLGQQSQYCGRYVTITNTDTGAQVTAIVADACPSCSSSGSLDLSVGAFTALAPQTQGVFPISWHFD